MVVLTFFDIAFLWDWNENCRFPTLATAEFPKFPGILSSILGTYQPAEFIFQCHIFLPFQTVLGILKAGILKCFTIPFSSGAHFVRTLPMTHLSWVALHGMAHDFIELDKAVVHVISSVIFL